MARRRPLREATEARGLALAPRLTVYPEYAARPGPLARPGLRFPVLDRSDAESLGRDDPGATWPERHQAAANVGTGAEVVQIGRRSTAWYSGADTPPPPLTPSPTRAAAATRWRGGRGARRAYAGQEVGETRSSPCSAPGARRSRPSPRSPTSCAAAGRRRRHLRGNRNINYTNVCTFKCPFCGFSKGPLSLNLRGAPTC